MTDQVIYQAYLPQSANQAGGDLPYFVGRQYGSGWLGTLARVAFPILKKIAGIASHAAEDVIYRDKPVKDAIVDNTMGAINKFVQKGSSTAAGGINRGAKRKASSYPLFQKKKTKKKK